MDCVVRRARLADGSGPVDIGIASGRIAAIAPSLAADAPSVDADGRLLVPGLVETHFHVDKTCIMDRCTPSEGTVGEAVRLTSAAKRDFTPEDVYARGRRTLSARSAGARCGCARTSRSIPASECAALRRSRRMAMRTCCAWRTCTRMSVMSRGRMICEAVCTW